MASATEEINFQFYVISVHFHFKCPHWPVTITVGSTALRPHFFRAGHHHIPKLPMWPVNTISIWQTDELKHYAGSRRKAPLKTAIKETENGYDTPSLQCSRKMSEL